MGTEETKDKNLRHLVKGQEDEAIALASDSPTTKSSGVPLLEKLKGTLANTPAERWEEAGEELDSTRKFQKPQETWERLFCTDTKNGVLVLRCSLPVKSNFFGGGYCFIESGVPQYFVEIRSRGWSPKMLIDPFYRGGGAVDKNYQVLADSDVARHLYIEVDSSVKTYREGLKRDFNDSVERLMANIHEQIQSTAASDWQTVTGDQGFLGYTADINGITLSVSQIVKDRTASFTMTLSKYGLRFECRDMNIIRDVFTVVDGSVRHASLEQLGKVLEDML